MAAPEKTVGFSASGVSLIRAHQQLRKNILTASTPAAS
jgi:hypothetical protein